MFSGLFSNMAGQLQSLLFTAPVVLLAIIGHEYAHGWVSDRMGDPTPRREGRLTLNPLKHLDPMGTLCMLFFHVGWANPVPINPMFYRNRKRGIICVSLAGPVANFTLAFLSLILEGLLVKFGSANSAMVWVLYQLCYYSAIVNIGLGLFNLIPLPPLDGSKIVGELWRRASAFYWRYQRYWRIVLLVCVFTGILSRPLGMSNRFLMNTMWQLVRAILRL